MNKFAQVVFAVVAFSVAQVGFAAGKTLIEMDGASPKAGMASAWKKVKDGEYEFTLDPSAEVKKGVAVTPAAVKSSLESKLGTTHGVKVTAKGANAVDVTYTCAEPDFLQQIAKTKIREGSQELALESSTSEGGIRANPGGRDPATGEIKGAVVGTKGDVLTVKVTKNLAGGTVKDGDVVKVKAPGFKGKTIFFQPGKLEGGVWSTKAVSDH